MDQKIIQPTQATFDGIAEDFNTFEETEKVTENDYEIITQSLSSSPMSVDDLCQSCDLTIQNIQTCLMDLELAGVITRHPGNRVSKAA
jgi:DNA processing protein